MGGLRKTRHRGTARVGWMFALTAAACNLIRFAQAAGGSLAMRGGDSNTPRLDPLIRPVTVVWKGRSVRPQPCFSAAR